MEGWERKSSRRYANSVKSSSSRPLYLGMIWSLTFSRKCRVEVLSMPDEEEVSPLLSDTCDGNEDGCEVENGGRCCEMVKSSSELSVYASCWYWFPLSLVSSITGGSCMSV